MPRFIDAVEHGRAVPIHGDGSQSRDFTYVENVVQANLLAGDRDGVEGKVLNVATGRQATVNELADTVGAVLGKPVEKEYLPTGPATSGTRGRTSARRSEILGYEIVGRARRRPPTHRRGAVSSLSGVAETPRTTASCARPR